MRSWRKLAQSPCSDYSEYKYIISNNSIIINIHIGIIIISIIISGSSSGDGGGGGSSSSSNVVVIIIRIVLIIGSCPFYSLRQRREREQ